ncbi:MAG: hypothetical protein AAF447_15685 [Myxococcota bacterium]
MPHRGDCTRCEREVQVLRPWQGYKVLRVVWYATLPVFVIFAPVFAADACFLTPLALLILIGGGPLGRAARAPSTCRRCGAVMPETRPAPPRP